MPRLLTCPRGHQWQTTEIGSEPAAGWPGVCPECGLAPKSTDMTHSETTDAATVPPPTTPRPDVANAEAETLVPATPSFFDTSCPLPKMPGFEILERLGSGGMGVVYKARDTSLDRLVAIKFILSGVHAGPKERKRFYDEAQVVARLEHPNIVQIYEIGEAEGWPYITLQYLEGGSLAQKLNGDPQLPGEAAKLVETLARATQAAHQRGIVHRDLKPGNVLLTADGTPKIADFGLAKRINGPETQTVSGTVMGTPSYMAPEQAHGTKDLVGPAADIHALGAILYELLTGWPPYKSGSYVDTIFKVMMEEPTPPRQVQPSVPRDLETICLKCLHKEPQKRYASAEDLAEDLRRFLAGEPIRARSLRPWERLARGLRRHRRIALAVSFVAITVLLSIVLATWIASAVIDSVQEPAPGTSAPSEPDPGDSEGNRDP
jgi:eukaryotic-like serine/threonine-protein kinase